MPDEQPEVDKIYKRLRPYYNANAKSLDEFSPSSTAAERRSAVLKAEKRPKTTEPLLALLRRNAELLGGL